ncbi:MAG: protein kinase, partial [Afipia sp.]|nr:protein kinase [Afipia sp.]
MLTRRLDDQDSDLIWEMNALAQAVHPGIVSFYHHFSDRERLFLVMEYCPEGTLNDRLFGGAHCTEKEVMEWGLALCNALDFAHGRQIVHHDIKPANVFFGIDGQIKVGDFGVANRNIGTRLYLAPEVLLRERATRTDPREDIYALGLTMIEAITGRHPFEDVDDGEAVQVRIRHDFVPTCQQRWVQEVLLKATHPTPELRFQSMRDFAEAIEANRVPYVFDGARMKAHLLAEKAQSQLGRKKWKDAEKLANLALMASPDCVSALMVAGRCHLLRRRLDQAEKYLSKAVTISPRTQAQKELGWLSLERGNIPSAISLLTDHLQRNSADYEAYNLLLKCYFLSDRHEASADLASALSKEKTQNSCFANNLFISQLLGGDLSVA